jgi:hypothetical protein
MPIIFGIHRIILLWQQYYVGSVKQNLCFYADDAALFLNPSKYDITVVHQILHLFGDASGLRTSFQKCVAYPIACANLDLDDIL